MSDQGQRKTTEQEVTCNECEQDFALPKPKRKVLQDKVYEFYFHCPHCNHKYISYYTDQRIRRDINRQKKRWKKYRQSGTYEAGRKILADIKMQDRLIKQDMDGLRERMVNV